VTFQSCTGRRKTTCPNLKPTKRIEKTPWSRPSYLVYLISIVPYLPIISGYAFLFCLWEPFCVRIRISSKAHALLACECSEKKCRNPGVTAGRAASLSRRHCPIRLMLEVPSRSFPIEPGLHALTPRLPKDMA
jgi:hypothetical protein